MNQHPVIDVRLVGQGVQAVQYRMAALFTAVGAQQTLLAEALLDTRQRRVAMADQHHARQFRQLPQRFQAMLQHRFVADRQKMLGHEFATGDPAFTEIPIPIILDLPDNKFVSDSVKDLDIDPAKLNPHVD